MVSHTPAPLDSVCESPATDQLILLPEPAPLRDPSYAPVTNEQGEASTSTSLVPVEAPRKRARRATPKRRERPSAPVAGIAMPDANGAQPESRPSRERKQSARLQQALE